jgi:iron only hydrogenase large subunit-like protein
MVALTLLRHRNADCAALVCCACCCPSDIAAMAKINGFNQILNLAWAEHEIVSDPVPEVLQWLLSQPASKT